MHIEVCNTLPLASWFLINFCTSWKIPCWFKKMLFSSYFDCFLLYFYLKLLLEYFVYLRSSIKFFTTFLSQQRITVTVGPSKVFSTSNHHSQLTIPGVLGRVWYLLFRSSLFCSKSLLKEQPWAIHSCRSLKKSNHESLLSLFVKERLWANSSLKRVMLVIRSF